MDQNSDETELFQITFGSNLTEIIKTHIKTPKAGQTRNTWHKKKTGSQNFEGTP